jgi:hypothetical protein
LAVSSWTMPVLVWPAFQADPHRPAATARRLVWISLAKIALPTGPSMALLFRSMSSSASTYCQPRTMATGQNTLPSHSQHAAPSGSMPPQMVLNFVAWILLLSVWWVITVIMAKSR